MILDWTEITVSVPVSFADLAGAVAMMTVSHGIYIEDYSRLEQEALEIAHINLIDEELLKKDRETAVVHIYIPTEDNPDEALSFLSERLTAARIPFAVGRGTLSDEDWADGWKKYFKPTEVGRRLLICPAWETPPPDNTRAVLLIEPGAAFGSGTHETTRLCLEALDGAIKGGERVLDIGCGSGILSIGALLLGAKEALGVDIDAMAVKTAKQNGELNGFFAPRFSAVCGNLADSVTGQYEVIVANIVADVIMSFACDARKLLKDSGVFITSGIIDTRADEVLAALINVGFTALSRHEERGWICFVLKKEEQV